MLCISQYLKWVKRSALWHLKATNCKKEGEAKITSENNYISHGRVSGPYLFNIFLNDLNGTLRNHEALFIKYAYDSTIIAPLWEDGGYFNQLVSRRNQLEGMSCNPIKCKELTTNKRCNRDLYSPIGRIPSCKEVEILGSVTFQCKSKFSMHVKNKHNKGTQSAMGPCWPGHYFCQSEKRLPQHEIKCTRRIHLEIRFNLA